MIFIVSGEFMLWCEVRLLKCFFKCLCQGSVLLFFLLIFLIFIESKFCCMRWVLCCRFIVIMILVFSVLVNEIGIGLMIVLFIS